MEDLGDTEAPWDEEPADALDQGPCDELGECDSQEMSEEDGGPPPANDEETASDDVRITRHRRLLMVPSASRFRRSHAFDKWWKDAQPHIEHTEHSIWAVAWDGADVSPFVDTFRAARALHCPHADLLHIHDQFKLALSDIISEKLAAIYGSEECDSFNYDTVKEQVYCHPWYAAQADFLNAREEIKVGSKRRNRR